MRYFIKESVKMFMLAYCLLFCFSCGKTVKDSRNIEESGGSDAGALIKEKDADRILEGDPPKDDGAIPPVPPGMVQAVDFQENLGRRNHVISVFKSLFFQSPENVDQAVDVKIRNLIVNQQNSFAYFCSNYENATRPNKTCGDEAINLTLTENQFTLDRAGYLTRACNEILAIDSAVSNMLGKVGLTSESDQIDGNIKKLFDLFFPGRQPKPGHLTALNKLAGVVKSNSGFSNIDKWRFMALPMCLASEGYLL